MAARTAHRLAALVWYLLRPSNTLAFQNSPLPRSRQATNAYGKLFSVQLAQVDVREQSPRNYDGFLQWAEYYGVVQDNFQLSLQTSDWNGAILFNNL